MTSSLYKLRAIEEEDRAAVEELMEIFGDELAAMDRLGRVIRAPGMGTHAVARMVGGAARTGGGTLVAEDPGGTIVGFVAGEVRGRTHDERFEVADHVNGVVTELFVAPDRRRSGLGRLLLEGSEALRRERGCGAVLIEVFAPNAGARAFYASLGYAEREIDLFRLL